MRRGFFSFVAIVLVGIAIFVAMSYIFTFKDFRNTAQKDLEMRKLAERMEDAKVALNRTLLDAIIDVHYYHSGCEYHNAPYQDQLGQFLDQYLANTSRALSDTSTFVNMTLKRGNDDFQGDGETIDFVANTTPIHYTVDLGFIQPVFDPGELKLIRKLRFDIELYSQNAYLKETIAFRDLWDYQSETDYVDGMYTYHLYSNNIIGLSLNSTMPNMTIVVICNKWLT